MTTDPIKRSEKLFAALCDITGANTIQEAKAMIREIQVIDDPNAAESVKALRVVVEEWPD